MTRRGGWRKEPWLQTGIVTVCMAGASILLLHGHADLAAILGGIGGGVTRLAGWGISQRARMVPARDPASRPVTVILGELLQEARRISQTTHSVNNHLSVLTGELQLALEQIEPKD